MKNNLLLAMLLPGVTGLFAQVCSIPQSQIDLHGNNIQARILNGGDLFWDLNDAGFIPNPGPNGTGPATIYNAGLWMGGVDLGGNLHLAAATYRANDRTDYFAGPLSFDGQTVDFVCTNWDRHFKVRGDRVAVFLDSLPFLVDNPTLAKAQFPDVMGWPASGNPFFSDLWGFDLPFTAQALAPFRDADQDGLYNPLQGDYPVVLLRDHAPFVPTEIVWCVFNDDGGGAVHSVTNGKSFRVEIQLTAWAFHAADQPVLDNTIFTSHKLIFHTPDIIDSCFVGLWADFDIGCYTDDYVGSAPTLDAFYAYNQDAIDGTTGNICTGNVPTFSDVPPVQSATFLNRSLDKCIPINNAGSGNPATATTDPNQPIEFYNYLTGHWKDGLPLTYGGNGYQNGGPETNHAFPDDPADPNGWSMCTANIAAGDRRMLGIHQLGRIVPGQVEELNVAWTVHPNPALPCGLGTTFADIATIRNLYDDDFVTATTLPLPEVAVQLFPNPANSAVTLRYGHLPALELRCFDAAGRLVRAVRGLPMKQYSLDVTGWQAGTYTVQLLSGAGSVARRLVVLR